MRRCGYDLMNEDCGSHVRASANVPILWAPTACLPLRPAWPATRKSLRPHFRNFAGLSPIFHLPGPPRKCRSNWKLSESTTSRASVEQGWSSFGLDDAVTATPAMGLSAESEHLEPPLSMRKARVPEKHRLPPTTVSRFDARDVRFGSTLDGVGRFGPFPPSARSGHRPPSDCRPRSTRFWRVIKRRSRRRQQPGLSLRENK